MRTFQDFEKASRAGDKEKFISSAIAEHILSPVYQTARDADLYDKQKNRTINEYVRMLFTLTGSPVEDFTASNNKIPSNFFHRLNTQRCVYSLGNGVSFTNTEERQNGDGTTTTVDVTKERLGPKFDSDLKDAGYKALIHGVTFCFWGEDRMYVFPVTQFVPLWDEKKGTLRAGIRFWRLAPDKPMVVVLYEEDGYTKYETGSDGDDVLRVVEDKKKYRTLYQTTDADDSEEVIGEENYSALPIVPFWGSSLHQSTLVGMREAIDSYDLIRSGFANDLSDCAQIYWIVKNYGGMNDADLSRFRDRLKTLHVAVVDSDDESSVTPYTQEIPYQARKQYLDDLRSGIYEDFGGLDVHAVAAGATNDHIDAAYQPLDEEADDFEYQVIECVQQILALIGIEDTPIFKRNRISNQREQTEMVLSAAQYLDETTILNKLPFISPDEVQQILVRKDIEDKERMTGGTGMGTEDPFANLEV